LKFSYEIIIAEFQTTDFVDKVCSELTEPKLIEPKTLLN